MLYFKPSFKAFIGSLLYAMTPLGVAAVITYFAWGESNTLLWILDGLTVLFFIYLFLQAIYVYRQKLFIDANKICLISPLHTTCIAWLDIVSAVLRERVNALTRTDRLLTVESRDHILVYNTSILDPHDEEMVLREIRNRTNLVVKRDRPSI